MAVLVCRLSSRGRVRLTSLIRYSSYLTTGLSCVYLAAVLYSWARHSRLLHQLVISLFDPIFYNLVLLGLVLLIVSMVTSKINRNIRLQPTNHGIGRTHWVWVTFEVCTMAVAATTVALMSGVDRAVDQELGPRYQLGVTRYMDSKAWQEAVDRVQVALQCCGAHSHTDWYSATWLPVTALPADPATYSKVVQPNGKVLVPVVPSSCCRESSPHCGHRALLEAKDNSLVDLQPADPRLVYTNGCVPAISRMVHFDVLIFSALLMIICLLQVVQVVAARYLYTSTLNSLLLGRPLGHAPGWLFGTEFSFTKGKHRGKKLEEYDQVSGAHLNEANEHKTQKSKKRLAKNILKSPCLAKLKNKCKRKKIASNSELVSETDSELPGRTFSEDDQSISRVRHKMGKSLSANLIDVVEEPINNELRMTKPPSLTFEDTYFLSNQNKSPKVAFQHGGKQANPFHDDKMVDNTKLSNPKKNYGEGNLDFNKKITMFENINVGKQDTKNNKQTKFIEQKNHDNLLEEPPSRWVYTPSVPDSEEETPIYFRNYMNSKT